LASEATLRACRLLHHLAALALLSEGGLRDDAAALEARTYQMPLPLAAMKAAMIARIAEAQAAGDDALRSLTQPKSREFVTNSRGQMLHVRTRQTSCEQPKGIVVFLHGLHAHCSRPHMDVYVPCFAHCIFVTSCSATPPN
jgi:hypothetical protein